MREAQYECMVKCHIPITMQTSDGRVVVHNKLFIPQDAENQIPHDLCRYNVGEGELVPHHFKPLNDVAREDREEQISHPEKFIHTEYDMGVIAELMVDAGFYDDETFYDDRRGQYVVRKSAKRVAQESIKETIGENAYMALLKGEDVAEEFAGREDAIKEMCKLGKDDKETRQALLAILKEANVTKGFFRGEPVEKLAGFIYDKGLYKE